jgi:hypothetical protein
MMDIAGYYAPTGDEVRLEPTGRGVVFPGSLPTSTAAGDVGRSRELYIENPGPARESARLSVGFRSQRVVRTSSVVDFGRTIDVVWSHPGSPNRGIEVTNALPIDLENVTVILPNGFGYHAGPVAAGASVSLTAPTSVGLPGNEYLNDVSGLGKDPSRAEVLSLFSFLTHAASATQRSGHSSRLMPQSLAILQKYGIDRSPALDARHALLLATALDAPVPIPNADRAGNRFVLIRKEVPVR